MALFDNGIGELFEGGAGTGIVVGLGVLLLAPTLLPAVGRMVRPLAIGALKSGMMIYNEAAATVREAADDMVAEARAELDAEGRGTPSAKEGRRSRSAEAST